MSEYFNPSRMRLKSWAESDRPREKLVSNGRSSLSEAELIAILLRSGSRDETAVDLAKRIFGAANNSLSELGKLNMKELLKFKGMGEAKALSIIAALELGRRRKETEAPERKKVNGSKDVYEYMEPLVADLQHEEFWIILLNRSNKVLKRENVSRGGVSGTLADARLIFKSAIEALASGIILCHNHPSGSVKPSDADMRLTKRLADAGRLLEISVLDHVIISETGYYSFADEGIL